MQPKQPMQPMQLTLSQKLKKTIMEVKRPQWGKNQNCQKSELSKKAKKAQTTVWTIRYHRSDMTGINCVRCVENRAFAGGAAGVGKKIPPRLCFANPDANC